MTIETWNLDAPFGFQGLRTDMPVTTYDRHLPHWRQDGATYFVTFRLADALPQAKLRELKSIKREFAAKHGIVGTNWQSVLQQQGASIPRVDWESFVHQQMKRVEHWLDQAMGDCCLKDPDVARIVVEALHYRDGQTYELGAFVVMPNHVHAIVRPLEPASAPLERILHGRKLHTAIDINRSLDRSGTLWQEESLTASFATKSTSGELFNTSATTRGAPA